MTDRNQLEVQRSGSCLQNRSLLLPLSTSSSSPSLPPLPPSPPHSCAFHMKPAPIQPWLLESGSLRMHKFNFSFRSRGAWERGHFACYSNTQVSFPCHLSSLGMGLLLTLNTFTLCSMVSSEYSTISLTTSHLRANCKENNYDHTQAFSPPFVAWDKAGGGRTNITYHVTTLLS